ncbi:TraR/DksA family transcriptional regulator [Thermithiobacillus plumbiphilus]|uniref:TraR/DksA family transcriptional regulator n=1 Tax=Thermithiobacillus plumbiphilus TaxID=1729899 RepID=A0ABU9D9L3_9PROT
MDKATENELRELLEHRRQDLTQTVREHLLSGDYLGGMRTNTDDGAKDVGDASVIDLTEDMTLERSVSEALELAEVQRALERMDRGEYGICVDCGDEIPVERLKVQPTATRDVVCQERFEALTESGNPPTL